MVIDQLIDIFTKDHRFITEIKVLDFDKERNKLYTLVPRNLFGRPIPFDNSLEYKGISKYQDSIVFFEAKFNDMSSRNGKPCFEFDMFNINTVKNLRKEERSYVESEAVVADFEKVSVATILDLSNSGLKIEMEQPTRAEFIEIFFDDENVPKRATGKIVWGRPNDENDSYLYGVELRYR